MAEDPALRDALLAAARRHGADLAVFAAAGVVAYASAPPARWATLAVVAVVLLAALETLVDRDLRRVGRRAAGGLGLAAGLGLLASGLQEVAADAGRAAVLAPAGLALAGLGFVVRSDERPGGSVAASLAAGLLLAAYGLHHGVALLAPSAAPVAAAAKASTPKPAAKPKQDAPAEEDHAPAEAEAEHEPAEAEQEPAPEPARDAPDPAADEDFPFLSAKDRAQIAALERAAVRGAR